MSRPRRYHGLVDSTLLCGLVMNDCLTDQSTNDWFIGLNLSGGYIL